MYNNNRNTSVILDYLNTDVKDINEMIKTGEILRKRDGNYCFSCSHCDNYFDFFNEIIDHMNKVLKQEEANQNAPSKLALLSYTEFVDVSVNVKCEVIDNYVNNINAEDDKDWSYVSDCYVDENAPLAEQICHHQPTSAYIGKQSDQKSLQCDNDKSAQDKFIKCCWCYETYNNFGLMLNHLTDDHNKKPSDVYSCEKCELFFKNVKPLSEHMLTFHGQDEHDRIQKEIEYQENAKPIQCVVCQLWTNGTKSFDAHTKQAHKMYRILQCYICRIYKKKPSGLIDHLKVHDRFRKYRCYECDNVEPKITNPNDQRSHKCVLCNVWFLNHATVRNHITDVHGQDQIYDCSICEDYTFKTDWDLKMHCTNVHQIPMDYECKYCMKHCKSIQSLREHEKSHSATSNTNLCTICGSKFRRKDYLIRHIKSHSEVKKAFNCYICNKTFESNGYLKNHIKRHTEKKMHQCEVCGKSFLLAGLLRKHIKEHEGEIWKCAHELCKKEFSNKSKLKAHEKTHVKERNFRCDVCLKTYKTSKNLRQHKLVHSVERRIKCRICNMTFNQGPEHTLHLDTHNNDVI